MSQIEDAAGGDARFQLEDQVADSSKQPLDCASWFILALFVSVLALVVGLSIRPLAMLLATVVALLPVLVSVVFIFRRIGDESLSKSFAIQQLFWGGVLGYFAALVLEIILGLFGMMAIFQNEILRSKTYFAGTNFKTVDKVVLEAKVLAFVQTIPKWKIILGALFVAFIIAGFVEEFVKYNVGRRVRKRTGISAHTFVAGIMLGALGLASTEHYAMTASVIASEGTTIRNGIALSVFRATVAFPMHVGSAMLFAIPMAQTNVLNQQASVLAGFALAVFFHGTFDAVAMVITSMILLQSFPKWLDYVVPVFDVLLAIALMVLCRRRYARLSEDAQYLEVSVV